VLLCCTQNNEKHVRVRAGWSRSIIIILTFLLLYFIYFIFLHFTFTKQKSPLLSSSLSLSLYVFGEKYYICAFPPARRTSIDPIMPRRGNQAPAMATARRRNDDGDRNRLANLVVSRQSSSRGASAARRAVHRRCDAHAPLDRCTW